jgi:hypothetical protein
MLTKQLFALTILSLLLSSVSASMVIKTKSMTFDNHRSINEGCLLVERQMKKEAIEKKCGTDFQASSFRFRSNTIDSLSKLYLETLSGYVTGFNNINTTIDASQDLNKFECTVRAKINITCKVGMRDPLHQPISASLNKAIYIDGDNVIINIDEAHHNRYVSIVQIITRANGQEEVWRLFPNEFSTNQFIPALKKTIFPDGYDLITKLIDGDGVSDESLMIITTINPPSVIKNKSSLEEFYFWLSEINLSNRREILLPYKVINTGKNS